MDIIDNTSKNVLYTYNLYIYKYRGIASTIPYWCRRKHTLKFTVLRIRIVDSDFLGLWIRMNIVHFKSIDPNCDFLSVWIRIVTFESYGSGLWFF